MDEQQWDQWFYVFEFIGDMSFRHDAFNPFVEQLSHKLHQLSAGLYVQVGIESLGGHVYEIFVALVDDIQPAAV